MAGDPPTRAVLQALCGIVRAPSGASLLHLCYKGAMTKSDRLGRQLRTVADAESVPDTGRTTGGIQMAGELTSPLEGTRLHTSDLVNGIFG